MYTLGNDQFRETGVFISLNFRPFYVVTLFIFFSVLILRCCCIAMNYIHPAVSQNIRTCSSCQVLTVTLCLLHRYSLSSLCLQSPGSCTHYLILSFFRSLFINKFIWERALIILDWVFEFWEFNIFNSLNVLYLSPLRDNWI